MTGNHAHNLRWRAAHDELLGPEEGAEDSCASVPRCLGPAKLQDFLQPSKPPSLGAEVLAPNSGTISGRPMDGNPAPNTGEKFTLADWGRSGSTPLCLAKHWLVVGLQSE